MMEKRKQLLKKMIIGRMMFLKDRVFQSQKITNFLMIEMEQENPTTQRTTTPQGKLTEHQSKMLISSQENGDHQTMRNL